MAKLHFIPFLKTCTYNDGKKQLFYLCTQNQVTWIWLIGVKVYY